MQTFLSTAKANAGFADLPTCEQSAHLTAQLKDKLAPLDIGKRAVSEQPASEPELANLYAQSSPAQHEDSDDHGVSLESEDDESESIGDK